MKGSWKENMLHTIFVQNMKCKSYLLNDRTFSNGSNLEPPTFLFYAIACNLCDI